MEKFRFYYKNKKEELSLIKKYFKIIEIQNLYVVYESSIKEIRKIKIDSLDILTKKERYILNNVLLTSENYSDEYSWTEYIAEQIDKTIKYEEYLDSKVIL